MVSKHSERFVQTVVIQPAEDAIYTLISLHPHIAYSFNQMKVQ